jgi:hypothetical protein
MKYPMIGISGQAGAGKDCIANMVAELTNGTIIALADPLKQLVRGIYGFSDTQLWGDSKERSVGSLASFSLIDKIALKSIPFGKRPHYRGPVARFIDDHKLKISSTLTEYFPRAALQEIGNGIREIAPNHWIDKNAALINESLKTGKAYNRVRGTLEDAAKPVNLVIVPDLRYRDEILALKQKGAFLIRVVDPSATNVDPHVSEVQQLEVPNFWFDLVFTNTKEDGLKGLKRAVRRLVKTYIKDVPTEHTDYCGPVNEAYVAWAKDLDQG